MSLSSTMSETVIFSNTRGFQVKQHEICRFVQLHQPTVFLIAEHFQSMSYHLRISGYTLAGSFCRNSREQGGVAIFVRDDVEYKPRGDLDSFCVYKQFEARSVEIPSRNLVVTVVYRPNAGAIEVFHSILDKVLTIYKQNTNRNYVMAGTFNLAKRNDSYTTDMILKRHNFKFSISSVSHVNGTCVDDFIVDFTPLSKSVMRDRFSDHFCIRLCVPVKFEDKGLNTCTVKDGVFNKSVLPSYGKIPYGKSIDSLLGDVSLLSSMLPKLQPLPAPVFPVLPIISATKGELGNTLPCKIEVSPVKKDPVLSESNKNNVPSKDSTNKPSAQKPITNSSVQTKQEVKSSIVKEQTPRDNILEVEAMISRCLNSDDFMNKFVSKLSENITHKLVESLSESLEEVKDKIHQLENKVVSLEAHIMKLEEELTL